MLKTIWAVSERGAVGMQSQALGLAEALFAGGGFLPPRAIEAGFRRAYTLVPSHPRFATLKALNADVAGEFVAPWPDVLITCGRKSALLALAIKIASDGRTTIIHVQDPKAPARHWDLLVVPEHDRVRGPNVLLSRGALHRVTRQKLEVAAAALAPQLARIPAPRLALLMGGNNRYFTLDEAWMAGFVRQLRQLVQDTGAGVMATISRRTGIAETAMLRGGLASLPGTMLWDGEGPNPYFGFLGMADAIMVTCDSVSMISEACATGKPVYVLRLPGKSRRFDAFFESLRLRGLIRWFDGRLVFWENDRLDDMDHIAQQVRNRLGWAPAGVHSHNIA